jgi:subtilisin family serine protease
VAGIVMRRLLGMLAIALAVAPPWTAAAAPGPGAAPEYWFDRWHVAQLWSDGARGQGVTIAEVDSGVNASLPELHGRILKGTDLGRGGDGQLDRDIDPFGHGTAMASIMVARPGTLGIAGLAPDARILPVAVPLDGTTEQAERGKVAGAVRWAADHGADVINLSIGGPRYPSSDDVPCPAREQRAVYHALAKGAVVIAAVGNTGPRRNTVEEPGVCLGVVAVGAVDEAGTVARFSAREPYLALDAPGVDVPSLGRLAGQAFSGDGTSQAAALASASAALVWSAHPGLTGSQVIARMIATLDHRRARPSDVYGYGLLDTYRAVTADVPADAPDPVAARAAPFRRRAAVLAAGLGHPPHPAARGRLAARPATGSPAPTVAAPASGHRTLGLALTVAGAAALLVLLALLLSFASGALRRE